MGNMPSGLQREKYAYLNGEILPFNRISINPYDLGLLRGYGVFDVMRTQNGKPFLLDEHWQRLQNSAKEINLKVPVKKEEYQEKLQKLLKLNGFLNNSYKKAIIRTVLTGGLSKDVFSPNNNETFLILIEDFKPLKKEIYQKGVALINCDFCRNLPKAKTTNYIEALKNYHKKIQHGAFEILYVKNDEILEASTSNIFLFKDNTLLTPKENILPGVTRGLVIKLAKKYFKVKEKRISKRELKKATEAFLTATNKDIVPVVKIGSQKIGNGRVDKNTKFLMKLFSEFLKKY